MLLAAVWGSNYNANLELQPSLIIQMYRPLTRWFVACITQVTGDFVKTDMTCVHWAFGYRSTLLEVRRNKLGIHLGFLGSMDKQQFSTPSTCLHDINLVVFQPFLCSLSFVYHCCFAGTLNDSSSSLLDSSRFLMLPTSFISPPGSEASPQQHQACHYRLHGWDGEFLVLYGVYGAYTNRAVSMRLKKLHFALIRPSFF